MVAFLMGMQQSPCRAEENEITLTGPLLALWKDPGCPLAFNLPSASLYCAVDEPVASADGSRRFRLLDKDQTLRKTLLRYAHGAEITVYVSTLVPNLVVGVKGFDGKDVRGCLLSEP